MKFKLFKEEFVVFRERTVVTVEREDIPDEYVDIPYLGSDAYDDYFVIGLYAMGDVLHLSLSKREWVRA